MCSFLTFLDCWWCLPRDIASCSILRISFQTGERIQSCGLGPGILTQTSRSRDLDRRQQAGKLKSSLNDTQLLTSPCNCARACCPAANQCHLASTYMLYIFGILSWWSLTWPSVSSSTSRHFMVLCSCGHSLQVPKAPTTNVLGSNF
jgi:hypothetical protein